MLHEMLHAANTAGEMKCQMRPENRPAQARPIGDGGIDFGDIGHAFRDEMYRLAPQCRLQPVGDMARHLLADTDRMLAGPAIESERLIDGVGRRPLPAHHLDERNEMRWVEGMT